MVNLNRESTYLLDSLISFYSEALTLYSVVLTVKLENGVLSDLIFPCALDIQVKRLLLLWISGIHRTG